MSDVSYKATMWAEMKPDLYAGKNCDEVRPTFECNTDGDMGSESIDILTLDATTFPPGTKITVQVPCCPDCGQEVEMCKEDEGCNFDWDEWRDNEYS